MRTNETRAAPRAGIPQTPASEFEGPEHLDRCATTDAGIRYMEAIVEETIAAMDRATRHAIFELAGSDAKTLSSRLES